MPGSLSRPVPATRLVYLLAIIVFIYPSHAWSQSRKKQAKKSTASTLPKLATEVAFKNLNFNRPVVLSYPDDGSKLLFVVEQHEATIQSFPNDTTTSDKKLFLQLPDDINKGNEEGLLGLAFHPKYKENGQFFVYYS